jgi:UDP-3-O-[3-hydroxymyristoyl] glucosamine N-acyltransferase
MRRRDVKVTLGEIARLINGKVIGDENITISGISNVEDAKPSDIVVAFDERHATAAFSSNAGAVLVPPGLEREGKSCITCEHPKLAMVIIAEMFAEERFSPSGISELAVIHPTARVAQDASVGPFSFIGEMSEISSRTIIYPFVYIGANVKVGCDCTIYPGVVIYDGVRIGDRVVIHANAVIGKDGFGFVWDGKMHRRIPQIGTVLIEDDVEVGANTCIDRATLGMTRVRKGTKIDNLVQIAHNCDVGDSCILCGMSGLAGSVKLGRNVTVGAQAGVRDHVSVGDGATIAGRAAVTKDVMSGEVVSGYPARPHKEALRIEAFIHQLPNLYERLKRLEERVKELEKLTSDS